jgi:hypothetical protein
MSRVHEAAPFDYEFINYSLGAENSLWHAKFSYSPAGHLLSCFAPGEPTGRPGPTGMMVAGGVWARAKRAGFFARLPKKIGNFGWL